MSPPRSTVRHSSIKINVHSSSRSLENKPSVEGDGPCRDAPLAQARATSLKLTATGLSGLSDWHIPMEEIEIGDRLGAGSFGEVKYGIWKGTEVAVKIIFDIDSNSSALEEFYAEVQVMAKLRHPCIVP